MRPFVLILGLALAGCNDGEDPPETDSAVVDLDLDNDGFETPIDCNDNDPAIHPEAEEIPGDGVDQNCDRREICYQDRDGDGYGSEFTAVSDMACTGYSFNSGDCHDDNPDAHPGAAEIPGNTVDDDCDGQALCFVDGDADGYGGPSVAVAPNIDGEWVCDAPESGLSTTSEDCDDQAPEISPGATEVAGNNSDENCDGSILCYEDADNDGQGSAVAAALALPALCDEPGNLRALSLDDCDDNNPNAYVGAPEIPGNGVDEDCNTTETCYVDSDNDSYGSETTSEGPLDCFGYANTNDDCNDGDPAIFPGAPEVIGDLVDDDCDLQLTCFQDADFDGYGINTPVTVPIADTCTSQGASTTTDDCNDAVPTIRPGVIELPADGVDQNCDTYEDCYLDNDGDGYGSADIVDIKDSVDCDQPLLGLSVNSDDCDDVLAAINPSALEERGNLVDEDCDTVAAPWVLADLVAGDLIVNEVMYNPDNYVGSAEKFGEWVEVLVVREGLTDLDGVELEDNSSVKAISSELLVEEGDLIVLAYSDLESDVGVVPDFAYGGTSAPLFSNSGDIVRLVANGLTLNEINYGSGNWPAPASGESITYDTTLGADNADGANWCVASTAIPLISNHYGTPGGTNILCP